MKTGVNQAPSLAVPAAPGGARRTYHADKAHDGFRKALGNAGEHSHGRTEQPGRSKFEQKHDVRKVARAEVNAEAAMVVDARMALEARATIKADDKLVDKAGVETTDEAGAKDGADADTASNEDGPASPLPHLKAEHAISAMMAMGPAARPAQSDRPAGTSDGKVEDQSGTPGRTVEAKVLAKADGTTTDPVAQRGVDAPPANQPDRPAQLGATVSAAVREAGNQAPAAHKPGIVAQAALAAIGAQGQQPKVQPGETSKSTKSEGKAPAAASIGETSAAQDGKPATAVKTAASSDVQAETGGRDLRDTAPEIRRNDPQPIAARLSVVGQQSMPAPAAPALSANASAIVSALVSEQNLRPAGGAAVQSQLFKTAQPVRSLKIQLNPAELGMVTANLKAAGEQHVENQDAYHRLSADKDAIVKSLQSLGYDIDRVSVQQPQAAANSAARIETSTDTGTFQRDTSSFQSGDSGRGSERSNGQAGQRGYNGNDEPNEKTAPAAQARAGGGLYI